MTAVRHVELPLITGPVYLLAEPQAGLAKKVYEIEPEPSPEYLFDHTPFTSLKEQSPLLFRVTEQGGLLELMRQNPQQLTGLLLTSPGEQGHLLQHLRALLEVGFDKQRKAIMRYYDPVVASYFWPATPPKELPRWMGPISQMFWFGGTWADKAEFGMSWHEMRLQDPPIEVAKPHRFILDDIQQQALIRQNIERFAFDWLQTHPVEPFAQLLHRIEAGLAAGYNHQNTLTDWLNQQAGPRMEYQG